MSGSSVWVEISAEGKVQRWSTTNGQKPDSQYDDGGVYSVTMAGNFNAAPYVLATIRSTGDRPSNRVISVIGAKTDLVTIGIKKGYEDKHDKRPFTLWATQP